MRLVYALQFSITPPTGVVDVSLPDMIKTDVQEWISSWYKQRKDIELSVPATSEVLSPLPFHSLEASFGKASSGGVHQAITWRYPAEPDDRLLWESRCEWASLGVETEFSFLLRIASREFLVAPPQFDIRRPRIVRAIISKYRCRSGGCDLSLLPQRVGVATLDVLLLALGSNERRLPIVLFSVDSYSEKPLADPVDTQDKLVGLAHVFVLDKWASFKLTDALGKSHSCFNGAIRIYWPGFDPSGDASENPILFPDRIESIHAEDRLVSDHLLRWFAPISSLRFAYGRVPREASAAVQAERQAEIQALREKAKVAGDYDELLRMADEEMAALKKQNAELSQRLESRDDELATAKANMAALSLAQAPGIALVATGIVTEAPIRSVRAAVDLAERRFADTLIFLKTAFASADDSPYGQPDKVLQALEAMHDVCRVWRESTQRKESMGSMEEAFASRGFTYKAKESVTSTGKWGEEYTALYDGTRVSVEPHLALGKGGPDTCLRIHFFKDEDEGRFVVAHVGRHKTNLRT